MALGSSCLLFAKIDLNLLAFKQKHKSIKIKNNFIVFRPWAGKSAEDRHQSTRHPFQRRYDETLTPLLLTLLVGSTVTLQWWRQRRLRQRRVWRRIWCPYQKQLLQRLTVTKRLAEKIENTTYIKSFLNIPAVSFW